LFSLTISLNGAFAHDRFRYGSPDSDGSGWQSTRNYGRSSETQQKISALSATADPNVTMPVLFGVSVNDISPNFGDPRSGGRTHEGEDIMATKGTPIVSPTQAVVIRTTSDLSASEGIAVYTANPGGETFVYYHLTSIGEGVVPGLSLDRGSLVGYVGNTGNASGGPAHLHFEIHNNSGTPMDPYPRLKSDFTSSEKMAYISKILTQTADPQALSQFLVSNFRSDFVEAINSNLAVPDVIKNILGPNPTLYASVKFDTVTSTKDLDVGASGADVIALQKYLIEKNKGQKAKALATAGATGYFGSLTKAALAEFQASVGISPAIGYYGSKTREYISADISKDSNQIKDGSLIRAGGTYDVYIVKLVGDKKFKRLILSPSVFESYGHLSWDNVINVDAQTADSFTTSNLVRAQGDEKVYLLAPNGDTGEKHWISSEAAFQTRGLDWDSIYEINEKDRDSYIELGAY